MSYKKKWDIRITNDGVKFHADVRVGDKGTSKKFITSSSNQDFEGEHNWQNLPSTKFHSWRRNAKK